MNQRKKSAAEQWVSIISQKELPAIASTVKVLEKFSNDDKSSLPMLSKSILHDQALSSCILKVANNCQRIGYPKITTVSRATVVLGVQAVKNICLTSTVIDSLFESKKLTPLSYQKLSELMARSFYAGIIAKMLVSDYNDDTQEEVYLASMMYTIGETAFWSTGGKYAEKLMMETNISQLPLDEACEKVIGCTFDDISKGLAKNWSLGSLVEKALENPELRTAEIKTIYLANKLSNLIMTPPDTGEELLTLLEEIGKLKNITVAELKRRINVCREQAIELLSSYGASILEENIKPLPVIELEGGTKQKNASLSRNDMLMNGIKELTALTRKSSDINEFFQYTLTLLAEAFQFDQASLYIFTQDKKSLKERFHHAKKANHNRNKVINLHTQPNIISYMVDTASHLDIKNANDKRWLNYISNELETLVSIGPTVMALIQINKTAIGLIIGQYEKKNPLAEDEIFDDYCFVVDHLNMCITLISK